jgi:hypothetical protein
VSRLPNFEIRQKFRLSTVVDVVGLWTLDAMVLTLLSHQAQSATSGFDFGGSFTALLFSNLIRNKD